MTVPAANALAGAVNALPAGGGNAQPVTTQPTRTASQALEDRIAARRKAADAGHLSLVQSTAEKATQAQRGPDGKFLPTAQATTEPKAKAEAPATIEKPPEKDDATASLKADLDRHKAELAEHHKLLNEYDEASELAVARIQRLEGENKNLRKALQAHGVSDDPRDIELARYRERDSAGRLAAERGQAEREQQAQAERDRARAAENADFQAQCTSMIQQYPALDPQKSQEAVDFWRAVYRSNAAFALAPTVAAAIAAKTSTAQPPRTLPRSSSSGGAPVSFDPRDVADKWKARQRAL